ncbi:MAG: hypothetical protein AB1629_06830 [Candidatus Omnitrophota bacterium]
MANEKIIFVACGQLEEHEINIGKKIKDKIDSKKGFKAFLAETEHDLDSLTSNIFHNLNICSGFIAVLHKRGFSDKKEAITSIWINQEIAIASFIQHELKRKIPVLIFKENGIGVDKGVLHFLHVNPLIFSQAEEILSCIDDWLSSDGFIDIMPNEYIIEPSSIIERLESSSDIHTYKLILSLKNVGKRTVRNTTFNLEFPKGIPIVSPYERRLSRKDLRGKKDYFIFENIYGNHSPILPGKIYDIYCFDFQINYDVYFDNLTKKNIAYTIFADDMGPVRKEEPLEGKNNDGTSRVNF